MKKIVSMILSIIMILSFNCSFAVLATQYDEEYDSSENAYDFMISAKILNPEEIQYIPDKIVTRGMFANLIISIGNYDDLVCPATGEIFADVHADSMYAPYIECAYKLGITSGYGDGYFGANDPVNLAQAEKMIIDVLGFSQLAKHKGGYPAGYEQLSAELKLSKGVSVLEDGKLNMKNIMTLLWNALNCRILSQTGYTNGEADYISDNDKTILTEKFKIKHLSGILNSNGYSDVLSADSTAEIGYIMVDNTILKCDIKCTEFLGCDVDVWYDASESNGEVVYIAFSDDTRIFEFDYDDVFFEAGKASCSYGDNDTKDFKISEYASYIVNGKLSFKTVDELNKIQKGKIRFISNNGDSTIDVVHITKYETYRVKGVSSDTQSLITDCGKILNFSNDNDELDVFIKKDGVEIEFGQIQPFDIILVAQSEGNGQNIVDILVSGKRETGKLIGLDELNCEIDSGVKRIDSSVRDSLDIGQIYEYSFDAFGNVAYAYKTDNTFVYGFLYAVKPDNFKIRCNIFSEKGNWVELDFADKVRIDDVLYKGEEISGYFESVSENDVRRLVRYNVNDEGKVVMIDFAQNIPAGSQNEDYALAHDIFRRSFEGEARYMNQTKTFDGYFFVDDSVKTFIIPDDYSKDDFRIEQGIKYSNDTTYTIEAYDISEKRKAPVLLRVSTGDKYTAMDYPHGFPFMIVLSKGKCLDYDSMEKPSLVGYYNGYKITFPVDIDGENLKQSDYDALKKGDVIQINYDDNGIIRYFRKYDISNKNFSYYTGRSAIHNSAVIKSGVVDIVPGANVFGIDNAGGVIYITGQASSKVYLYDKSKEDVRIVSVGDIMEGDTIVLRCYNYLLYEAVVIR